MTPSETALAFSSACSADENGANAFSRTIRAKREKSACASIASSTPDATSSASMTSKRPSPEALS